MKEVQYISLKDIWIFIVHILKFALKKWKLLLVACVAGGILGFAYASFQKPIYHARLSFLLNENEQSQSLNLSSLAGIAGISGVSGGNVNEEKLLFIANSRFLIGTALLQEAEIGGVNKLMVNHFIDLFNIRVSFKSDTAIKEFSYFTHKRLEDLSYTENKVMDKILKEITEGKQFTIDSKKKSGIVSQNTGIIILEYKSANEVFAKTFLEILYTNLSKYYTNKTISRQLKNYALIKERADSIKEILFSKENYGAQMLDDNIGIIKMQGRIEIERNKRDIEMLSLMYGEVLKNLEVAKFALENQTPVFQTIDIPTYPLEKKKMSRLYAAISIAAIAGFCFFIWLLIKNSQTVLGKNKMNPEELR
ncbi:MAG: hypothetical protein Q8M15_03125 [Bacteroidota bacterium]|nr:hypothetical protein [Bacteroidota bacterium]